MNKIFKLFKIINKNAEIGYCLYKNKIYFYKEYNDKQKFLNEVKGYDIMLNKYNIPKRCYLGDNVILYENIKDLKNNTIYDKLYFKKRSIDMTKILDQYSNNLYNRICIDENKTNANLFFHDRLNLLDYYEKNIHYKNYEYNGKVYNFSDVIFEIKQAIIKSKKVLSFITQGDPTDTNICDKGIFTDFENAGLNSLISEIAIFFVSFSTHGIYYYPKYNPSAYKIRKNIYQKSKKNIKESYFNNKGECVILNYQYNIPTENKKIIYKYLKMIKYMLTIEEIKEVEIYLKYYIAFRILTPMDILKMEINDTYNLIFLCIYYLNEINTLDDLMNLVK